MLNKNGLKITILRFGWYKANLIRKHDVQRCRDKPYYCLQNLRHKLKLKSMPFNMLVYLFVVTIFIIIESIPNHNSSIVIRLCNVRKNIRKEIIILWYVTTIKVIVEFNNCIIKRAGFDSFVKVLIWNNTLGCNS